MQRWSSTRKENQRCGPLSPLHQIPTKSHSQILSRFCIVMTSYLQKVPNPYALIREAVSRKVSRRTAIGQEASWQVFTSSRKSLGLYNNSDALAGLY